MDDLLDDSTFLVVFLLVLESEDSYKDVLDESYEDKEEKESDKISIYFCAIWTRSCPFACSVAAFPAC